MEAYFDFDTEEGEEPEQPADDERVEHEHCVTGYGVDGADLLERCFRLRLQRSWAEYYAKRRLTPEARSALVRHNVSQLAPAIPVVLVFFLLLAARGGLPTRQASLDRLNRARARARKRPLLEHIEVSAPLFRSYETCAGDDRLRISRRRPRLHQVRGHLVRRGNQLFWRVPHLRGRSAFGYVSTRTVTWTFDGRAASEADVPGAEVRPASVERATPVLRV
jgi:hypothetical protein